MAGACCPLQLGLKLAEGIELLAAPAREGQMGDVGQHQTGHASERQQGPSHL
jgi:hypothetical protein